MKEGILIYVNSDAIHAGKEVQNLTIRCTELSGRQGTRRRPELRRSTSDGTRIIQLSPGGIGSQTLPNGKTLKVELQDKPIRVSTSELCVYAGRERYGHRRWDSTHNEKAHPYSRPYSERK